MVMKLLLALKTSSILLIVSLLFSCGGGGGSGSGTTTGNGTSTVNSSPVANAGTDQAVDENTVVTLSGSGTDSDGTIASYSWSQTSGTAVTLSDASVANPSFTAPDITEDETLSFQLMVTDNDGAANTDNIDILINHVAVLPVVSVSSDFSVVEFETVTIVGSATSENGDIVSYEWSQTSGVAIDLIDDGQGGLKFDALPVSEATEYNFKLTATDETGVQGENTVTVTFEPYIAQFVDISPSLNIPASITTIDASGVSYQSAASDSLQVMATESNTLLQAKDSDGTLFLSAANMNQDLFGNESSVTEFNNESSAIVLIGYSAGVAIYNLTTEVIENITTHVDFSQLVTDMDELSDIDKNFLDRLTEYENITSQISSIAENLKNSLKLEKSNSYLVKEAKSTDIDLTYKDEFYCVSVWIICSPWNEHQAWNWFGDAKGIQEFYPDSFLDTVFTLIAPGASFVGDYASFTTDFVSPPFLASSEDTLGIHAFANPNMVNYVAEFYSDGELVDWYITPRNSTLVQKLLNSGAAYREFSSFSSNASLTPEIDQISFNKYFSGANEHNGVSAVRVLNALNLVFSAANIVSDLSSVNNHIQKTVINNDLLAGIAGCALTVTSSFDFYVTEDEDVAMEQFRSWVANNLNNVFELLVLNNECGNIVLYGGQKLSELLLAQGARSSIEFLANATPVGWVKIAFDLANDALPVSISYLSWTNSSVDYSLQWSEQDGVDYISDISTNIFPIATFETTQQTEFDILLDASDTTFNGDGTLSYQWLVDDVEVSTTGPTYTHDFLSVGSYDVTLIVTDDSGNQSSFINPVNVVAGTAPVVNSVTCVGYQDKTALFVADVSDAENDIATINWYTSIFDEVPALVTDADTTSATLTYDTDKSYAYSKVEVIDSQGLSTFKNCIPRFTEGNPISGGLVTYYPFDNDSSDDSGNENDLIENGSLDVTDDGAIFSGSNFAYVESNEFTLLLDDLSISFWVQASIGSKSDIVGHNKSNDDGESHNMPYHIYFDTDGQVGVQHEYGYGVNDGAYFDGYIIDGQWTHLSVTRSSDTQTYSLYINGEFTDSFTFNELPTGGSETKLVLGAKAYNQSQASLSGSLNEFRIYNRALTDSEIESLYLLNIPENDDSPDVPVATGNLNDTGITDSDVDGDDANYGRDALAATGQLAKVGGGNAGFDFTKLDENGDELDASATEWSCVLDNVTGLIWEVKTDDGGLQDKDNTYTWYNPDDSTNGGDAGAEDGGSCPDTGNCDTQKYVVSVNRQGLCGASDWQMPNKGQLRSIVDYGNYSPAIDENYFPNTVSNWYWSSSPYASVNSRAWRIDFNYFGDNYYVKYYNGHVRLVRAEQ